jgi:hypothetical protein
LGARRRGADRAAAGHRRSGTPANSEGTGRGLSLSLTPKRSALWLAVSGLALSALLTGGRAAAAPLCDTVLISTIPSAGASPTPTLTNTTTVSGLDVQQGARDNRGTLAASTMSLSGNGASLLNAAGASVTVMAGRGR